jgi:hypothetical protein
MSGHLRFAGTISEVQAEALRSIVHSSMLLSTVLVRAQILDLPDWWVVAGAIYNTVWNDLTGRPSNKGIKDI